ncbi:hypothetical protein FOC4_g10012701 [Fusarium odoratissimum]|uniref:Uncharacterized protein n=1 Tax=Fusarium oxysporum f. sp. cubense (strain race 4) TaxID=2502994 RepID=N1RNT0_FUSC4|nr:hypothetical protein FOC4_g10012701 [Fusarium odoratissimum]
MAVFKLKAIAIILAFCAASVAATGGETATCLSDHTTTETAVTDAGYSISDGTLVSTMNICTVTHETKCDHVASVPYSVEMHPSSAAGATAPADSSATSVGAQGTGAQSTGAPVVPVVPVPPSSGPSYVPGPGTASGEQGTNPSPTNSAGVENPSPSAVVSATDVPGVQTTTAAYGSSVTDTAVVVTDSETGYETAISSTATDTYPSSAEETDESTPTGTPGVTASAAAKMLAPGAALSIAGMLIAVIF